MVEKDKDLVPYKIVKAPNGDAWVEADGKNYSPSQISRLHPAEDEGDRRGLSRREGRRRRSSPFRPTSTTPSARPPRTPARSPASRCCASSTSRRRRRSPTASTRRRASTIAVYDLGGGTFDVSILEIGDGVFEVKSTNGDTFLGGEDFDMRLVDYLADEFKKEQGIDLRSDKLALQRLKEAAEKAKIELSSATQTEINLPFITADASGPEAPDDEAHARQARGAGRRPDPAARSSPASTALKDAGLTAGEIDEVVLVGGMTRMPKVQRGGEAVLRQGAAQGRQPGRGRRHRRRDPGRRAAGRRQGRAAARRDPAVARHRDAGRRVHPPDRPQHHHPDQEEPGLLDRRGQPDRGDHPRLPGRARDGGRQQAARPVRPGRHPAGAARRAADRGHLRHRRQRHRQRLGQGQGAPARSSRSASRPRAACRDADIEQDGQGRRGARRRGQEAARAGRGPQPGRGAGPLDREVR